MNDQPEESFDDPTPLERQQNRDVAALQNAKLGPNPSPFDYWMAACAYARTAAESRIAALERDGERFLESCPSAGVKLIAQERIRQISDEGWTPEHDAEHTQGEMARAASCYAIPPEGRLKVPLRWPWDLKWWKPSPDNRERELVKAGALIAAEIDRLRRAAQLADAARGTP